MPYGIISTIWELLPLFYAVHPRVARQQYGGEVNMQEFENILAASKNRVVYNEDLRTPADMEKIAERYPDIDGVMIARGVLGRPSLFAEFESGEEWSHETRIKKMLTFHLHMLEHYSSILCGDTQILSKIKPFWEYAEEEIGRKAWKAIKKASNLAKYHSQ